MPLARGWNHPNPARIGFGDFLRLGPPETLSGSVRNRKSPAHARISSDSPINTKTGGLDGGAEGI